MEQKTGYKEMLRDRLPKVVDYALKWCKAKQLWINHVYNNFIGIYISKEDRNMATRTVLGISKKYHQFVFNTTIDWDNLSDEEKESWANVENWVIWFQKYYQNIENIYSLSKLDGESDIETLERIKNALDSMDENLKDSLGRYLLKCIKQ